jgi:hypothetical protein
MAFRDIGTKIDDKIMGAKVALIRQLETWELNFVGLAGHLIDHGLAFDAETEELLDKTRAALLLEKAKIEKELAGPAPAAVQPEQPVAVQPEQPTAVQPEQPTVIEHDFSTPPVAAAPESPSPVQP